MYKTLIKLSAGPIGIAQYNIVLPDDWPAGPGAWIAPEGFKIVEPGPDTAPGDFWNSESSAWEKAAPPAVPVPSVVTPYQARVALTNAGLRSAVEAWVTQQSQTVQDAWNYALEIRRDNSIVLGAAEALGLTESQLDELFIVAGAIVLA